MIHPKYRKIWWLASYPKSGNTWIRLFINSYVSGFPVDINSAFQFAVSDHQAQVTQLTCARAVNQLTLEEQAFCRPAVLVNLLNLNTSRDIMVKTHHAKVCVQEIPMMVPTLSRGAIYVIRDPRDVAVSFADHVGEPMDLVIEHMNNMKFALRNKDGLYHLLLTWSEHVKTWTLANKNIKTLVIKYEDLLTKPHEEFTKVIEFITLNVDEEKLNFAIEQTSFKNLRRIEDADEEGFIEVSEESKSGKFFRVGKAGQWREVLTTEQVRKIETDHKEIMEEFGYELTGV